jgi:hypothetical protein
VTAGPRVVTRFRGRLIEAAHDTATGEATTPDGRREPCPLAEFIRAVSAERRVHLELGFPYAIEQEIEDG